MARKREGMKKRGRPDNEKSFKHDYSKEHADKTWPYRYGKMDRSAKVLLFLFPLLVISGIAYMRYMSHLRSLVNTPLNVPLIIKPADTLKDAEKFWGTYRSGLYFGMKTRSPQSPVAGEKLLALLILNCSAVFFVI